MATIIIDIRPIVSRTYMIMLAHNIDVNSDTCTIILEYGIDKLLCDLVLYGNEYMDLPGNPHYVRVTEKLEHLYNTELDSEIMDFVLAELEYTLFTYYRVDIFLFSPIEVHYPLLKGELLLDST